MKLRNKKTGEIVEPIGITCISGRTFVRFNDGKGTFKFELHSLAELIEVWEDYEEPRQHWFIATDGRVLECIEDACWDGEKAIGNYFGTREEAEKAVEKLKAWKFLKDNGFKILGIRNRNNKSYIEWSISQKVRDDHFMSEAFNEALHSLFGGEE